MLENLFDYKLDNGISFNITKNEVYTQFLMYTFFKWNKSIVIVTPTLNEANQLYTNLKYYLKDKVFIFPDDDFLTKKAIASSPELMYMRMKFLNDNKVNDNKILICHTSSFLKKLPSKSNMNSKKIEVGIKSVIDRDDFINKLINIGYKKDSLVTNTGEFSVRGFVIDVFPIFEEHPVRIEFFDEEVMEIKYFDENSQLSIRNIDTIVLKPIKDEYSSENSNVLSYLDKPLLIYQDYNQITMVERSIIEQINYYNEVNSNFMLSDIMSLNTIFVNTIDNVQCDYDISASSIVNYGGDINKFKKDVDAEDSFLCTKDKELINRLNFNKNKIIDVDLLNGFIYNGISYYSKNDLFYHKEQVKYNTGYKMGKKIDSIDKLEIGDYVVHKTSGIGVYMGITTIMKAGVPMDYILIKYKGDDKLYLPVDKVDSLYKYSSKDGARPVIHKLNSIEWQKTKMRIKKKIHDISNELIKIYKNRSISKVEPFMEDTPEQVIFENEFSYEETPDQLKTTMEIKKDLESSKPMDRLLCGDVGYGKTEVIFRAVFKAVMNNKQVMYLCPTTLLSYQQYVSALSRFKNHAVNIALLNRYTTKKETNSILKDLEEGKIDVIFGTHRLLSGDIKFKDLKTNPLKFTDIYIKDDQIFINFIIEYCKNNNIPYSLLATTKEINKEKKSSRNNLTKEELYEKDISFIVIKEDDKDNISFYKEPFNDLEKQNEIENKLKISVNSVKQLKNTITYLNEILDKTFVYQVIKTFNVNDDDFNVIITLKNNLTIIIKGTYLINSLIENLNLEYEHNKERVIAYE